MKKNILKNIFSIYNKDVTKIVCIFGVKFKFRNTKKEFQDLRKSLVQIKRKLANAGDTWHVEGVDFYLPNYPIDFIQSSIVDNDNFFEVEELIKLDEYITEGAVIFDVGANIGNHTLYWSTRKKPQRIYSFEPIKKTYSILEKNIQLNDLSSTVKLHNVAVSASVTTASIASFDKENMGGTHVKIDVDGDIQTEKLDNIVIEENKLDFLKIDVEGHEMEVFMGGLKTIEKYKPYIFVETFDNADKIKELLKPFGYSMIKEFSADNYLFSAK